MNSKQRKQYKKMAIRELGLIMEELTNGDVTASVLEELTRLIKLEQDSKRLKVKFSDQYGSGLSGHWFYVIPADNFAEVALKKHIGEIA